MASEWQKNALALLVGALVAFGMAELGLRAYQYVSRDVPFFSALPGYRHTTRFPLSPFLVFGPHLDLQLEGKARPGDAYLSHQGFRTRDTLGAKPPGEYRVFVLGGSTTLDRTNEEGIHWPLIAEEELHSLGRGEVRVYNAAMSAYSSAHSLVRFQFDVLQYDPDMIWVMHNVNDLSVNYYAWYAGREVDANYLVKYGVRESTGVVTEQDVAFSRVIHSARRRLRAMLTPPLTPSTPDYSLEPARGYFKRNLRSIVALARAHGVAPVLLTMPMCESDSVYEVMRRSGGEPRLYPEFTRFKLDFESYNEAIREVATELDVALVDLRSSISGDPALYLDVVHHSTAGVRAIGDAVAEGVLPLLPSR